MTDPIVPTHGNHSPSTSMSLLQLALAEDCEAWKELVFLYSPLVERWCRRRRLREDEVQDVGQDVFLTLYQKLHLFRKEQADHSFRKWLRTLTENKVSDYLKKKLRLPCVNGSEFVDEAEVCNDQNAGADSDAAEEASDRSLIMRRCLELVRSEFEPRSFEAFRMVAEGKTVGEVVHALSMTAGAVYTARSRITKRLREMLVELEEDLPEP